MEEEALQITLAVGKWLCAMLLENPVFRHMCIFYKSILGMRKS